MCCGQNSAKKNQSVSVQSQPTQQAKVIQFPLPQPITANNIVIPKAVKQQLIMNQQVANLARVPKKT